MVQITKDQLAEWEQQLQDAKAELEYLPEQVRSEPEVSNAIDMLNTLERQIWDKKIEPEPIQVEEKGRTIKVTDYKEAEPYYIEI